MYNKTLCRNKILQSKPEFSDEYLCDVLQLPVDSKIVSKIIEEGRLTDTTRIMKLLITWKEINELEQQEILFFKLPIFEKQENAFDKWSMHEIDFYENVDGNSELPLVKCHDAYIFDDKKSFLLLLKDISSDYCSAGEINRNEMKYWLMAAESLAKFHSFFWDGANSTKLNPIQGDNETIEEKIFHYKNALEKFLPYASDYYTKDILSTYQLILEDAIVFERNNIERREQNKNISVIHGDSHIFNFMFPKASFQQPLIVDFQFWRMGVPTIDLMHLTRVAFPFMNEPERYLELIAHYHSHLQENGVTNYSLEECMNDFYLSTAMATFGPVFNYVDFGLGHEYWGKGVLDTINNYEIAKTLLNDM